MKIKENNAGMTLVEVLLATAIIVFAAAAIVQFYLSNLLLSEADKEETIAMAHLVNMAEAIKCSQFSDLIVDFPNGVSDGPAGNSYAVTIGGYALKDEHIVVSYTNPNSDPLEINISITWQDRKGRSRTRNLVTKRTG